MSETPPAFNEEDFFGEEEQEQEISLEGFDRLCEQCFELRADVQKDEALLKAKKQELQNLQQEILHVMRKHKKQNYSCEKGTLYQIETTSVSLPQGEEKKKFFEFLKGKGVFEDVVHMNSRTFNKFYKDEREIALENGDVHWSMPGVGEETITHKIGMRGPKK